MIKANNSVLKTFFYNFLMHNLFDKRRFLAGAIKLNIECLLSTSCLALQIFLDIVNFDTFYTKVGLPAHHSVLCQDVLGLVHYFRFDMRRNQDVGKSTPSSTGQLGMESKGRSNADDFVNLGMRNLKSFKQFLKI